MKTLTLALAATALAATSGTFVTGAQAGGGGRGGHSGLHFHLYQLQLRQQQQESYEQVEYVRRKRAAASAAAAERAAARAAAAKEASKQVAVVSYSDGQGRQFDTASKVWFDGKGQCFKGSQAFTFKNGSWSYGDARWIESSAGWGVTSGKAPESVSCDGIKTFEAKLKPAEIKPVALKQDETPNVAVVESANSQNNALEKPTKVMASTPETTARAECKKYFPSIGEMVSVPCGE
jgi:hypothetical protein